jgi:hypothetical protein
LFKFRKDSFPIFFFKLLLILLLSDALPLKLLKKDDLDLLMIGLYVLRESLDPVPAMDLLCCLTSLAWSEMKKNILVFMSMLMGKLSLYPHLARQAMVESSRFSAASSFLSPTSLTNLSAPWHTFVESRGYLMLV